MEFRIVNPLSEPRWDSWVSSFDTATVFHTSCWAKVLAYAYSYEPYYGVLQDGESTLGVLPVVEVASFVTGCRGVSLPFSDECSPLLQGGVDLSRLIEPMKDFGLHRRWNYLELRGGSGYQTDAVLVANFMDHRLTIEQREELQFKKIAACQRRNIRKALREGVEVLEFRTRDAMDTYYRLHCITRRRHGIPPQPRRFFHALHEHVIKPGYGHVLLAHFREQWIAGGVFLQFGGRCQYKFGASDYSFQHLRANSLLMYEAICRSRVRGEREFSFGRTDPLDVGLLQFKRGWGCQEGTSRYWRVNFKARDSKGTRLRKDWSALSNYLLRRTPIPVLRVIGDVLYRHLG